VIPSPETTASHCCATQTNKVHTKPAALINGFSVHEYDDLVYTSVHIIHQKLLANDVKKFEDCKSIIRDIYFSNFEIYKKTV